METATIYETIQAEDFQKFLDALKDVKITDFKTSQEGDTYNLTITTTPTKIYYLGRFYQFNRNYSE